MSLSVLHLVSCSTQKLPHLAIARELYAASPRFKMTRAIVQHEPWAILSAKHGLIWPDLVVEPYNETLANKPKAERKAWAARVLANMPPAQRYVIWAGEAYAEFLAAELGAELPLKGLGIGQQLAFLSNYKPAPTLLTAARAARDLFIRCDAELIPKNVGWATDDDWNAVREYVDRALLVAS